MEADESMMMMMMMICLALLSGHSLTQGKREVSFILFVLYIFTMSMALWCVFGECDH